MTFCSVSSCRPLSNKIGFTRFGVSTQKLFSFRLCCSSVTGSTGPSSGTTAGHFRGYFRIPLPLRLCYRAEVAPEVTPEVPVNRYYRSILRNYRRLVPDQLPAPTSASVLLTSGSGTGTCSGTTGKPEVPSLFPVLPVPRSFSSSRWQAFLGGPEVPPSGPVLPVLRVFVS